MTALRLIPLPIHAALEMLAGLALGVAPFVLGLGTPAAIVGVVAGALVVGMALQSVDETLNLALHRAADQGLALGLVIAAAVMAASGYGEAAVLFAAVAGAHLLLIASTRYTAR